MGRNGLGRRQAAFWNGGDARGKSLAGTPAPSGSTGSRRRAGTRRGVARGPPAHGLDWEASRLGVGAEEDAGRTSRGPPVFKYAQASWEPARRCCERQVRNSSQTHCLHSARRPAWGRHCERCGSSSSSWWSPDLCSGEGRLGVGAAGSAGPSAVHGHRSQIRAEACHAACEREPQDSGAQQVFSGADSRHRTRWAGRERDGSQGQPEGEWGLTNGAVA